jgi:hypothetical protein
MSNKIIPAVGLFGTCGSSVWRASFIEAFKAKGVDYFNPQVADWTPELATVEADHLAGDAIVMMAVTGETVGAASLVEAGLLVARAIQEPNRFFLLYIEEEVDPSLEGAKDSNRARRLLLEHLSRFGNVPNLEVVASLEEALDLSVKLWWALARRHPEWIL